jgi:hypothetical protein
MTDDPAETRIGYALSVAATPSCAENGCLTPCPHTPLWRGAYAQDKLRWRHHLSWPRAFTGCRRLSLADLAPRQSDFVWQFLLSTLDKSLLVTATETFSAEVKEVVTLTALWSSKYLFRWSQDPVLYPDHSGEYGTLSAVVRECNIIKSPNNHTRMLRYLLLLLLVIGSCSC